MFFKLITRLNFYNRLNQILLPDPPRASYFFYHRWTAPDGSSTTINSTEDKLWPTWKRLNQNKTITNCLANGYSQLQKFVLKIYCYQHWSCALNENTTAFTRSACYEYHVMNVISNYLTKNYNSKIKPGSSRKISRKITVYRF